MEDFPINVRIKLAALWTSTTFCYLYGDYFELYTPGKVDSLVSGDNVLGSPTTLLVASLVMVIPPLMIAASVLLPPRPNKWLNVVFGALFTVMMIAIALGSLTSWYGFYVFLAIVEALLTALVVRYAMKWPGANGVTDQ